MKNRSEIVYKGQIIHLLLAPLQLSFNDVEDSKDFDNDYRKRLKFQKNTDHIRYRACVDLLEDSEFAIANAFKYQLGDLSNKNTDKGEMYLRLYGVLNAVYLQINAIRAIANLLNLPGREKSYKELTNLDVYKLRGMAGSHTVDYMYDKDSLIKRPGISKITSFKVVFTQIEETGSKIKVIDEHGQSFEYSLLKILHKYEKLSTEVIIELIRHMIGYVIYGKEEKKHIKTLLNDMLPNLIDYRKTNENRKYILRENRKLKNYSRRLNKY